LAPLVSFTPALKADLAATGNPAAADSLASLLRGSGNTLAPALAFAGTATVQVPLSGALTLGWGPFPRLGIAGAATSYVIAFGLASLVMAVLVWRSTLRPQRAHLRLEGKLFREILRVGAISSVSALQTVRTAVILTGFVARFGTAALAGYGVGVRLELLQVPIVFAIAQALVVMVGTNIGAGQIERARRNVPRATFIHGDIMSLAFAPATFDAVVMLYTLCDCPASLGGIMPNGEN